jgi:hypothetical protein
MKFLPMNFCNECVPLNFTLFFLLKIVCSMVVICVCRGFNSLSMLYVCACRLTDSVPETTSVPTEQNVESVDVK